VIVVAEGAGQNLLPESQEKDDSGNPKLGNIGAFLTNAITSYFKEIRMKTTLKYIDPSYQIRSLPASAFDAEFCTSLAQGAVHAAMSGRTDMYIGVARGSFIHVPIGAGGDRPKVLDPRGSVWQRVLEATRQPSEWC
jgi:6-phosphofructokinase 1